MSGNQGFLGWSQVVWGVPYVRIEDQKANATAGGTFTSGAWRTRDLNTKADDTAGIASVASNQITLPPGTYRCDISAPSYNANDNQARLQNITGGTTLLVGRATRSDSASNGYTDSRIQGRFTLSATAALEVQHWCFSTRATDGFGRASAGFTGAGLIEIYTRAEFWKEG